VLTPEFAHSSALHAARALLHHGFAEIEASAPERLAHRIVSVAWEAAGPGRFALRCDVARLEVTTDGGCVEQRLDQRFTFADDARGGELFPAGSALDGPSREAAFAPTWSEHRARAFAHRWLWIWENLGDASAFDELLGEGVLDVRFHTGPPIATRDDFRAAARRLGSGVGTAHHVLDALHLAAAGPHYAVTADVSWCGESAGGTPLRARSRDFWQLVDAGGRYPRLERLRVELTEPLRAAVPEEAVGPSVPNAPSDDAESGGP
jgi:hypothetical protein